MLFPVDWALTAIEWMIGECLNHPVQAGEQQYYQPDDFCMVKGYYQYADYYSDTTRIYVPMTMKWMGQKTGYNYGANATSIYANFTTDGIVNCSLSASGGKPIFYFPSSQVWTYSKGAGWNTDTLGDWTTPHTTTGSINFGDTIGFYYGFGWKNGFTPAASFSFSGLPGSYPVTTITNLRLPDGSRPTSTDSQQMLSINLDPTETYSIQEILVQVETDLVYCSEFTPEEVESMMDVLESEFLEESETVSGCGCACGDTIIYVNADGSLTLQNDISGNYNLAIDNNADLSLNVNAAAGAFGAGAVVIDPDAEINVTAGAGAFGAGAVVIDPDAEINITAGAGAFGAGAVVIDPDAEINITAGAGAFGAGAFGAGAIVSPDVDINGSVDVGDISGEINLSASDVSFELSAGDVNIDQSGATNNNTYNNTTNNYYYGTTEPVEDPVEPFTIDYNEILSEGELESILNQETYDIIISTDSDDVISVPDTIPDDVNEMILLPSDVVSASSAVVGYGSQIISDLGLTPIYAPLALFSCFCWIIRGGK